jgi:anti-sigma factor RsiW
MSCQPERVTGYVDGALEEAERLAMEAHLTTCSACREQAAFERELRARLRLLPRIEPRPQLERKVQQAVRRTRRRVASLAALPFAAGLVLGFLWLRGSPEFVGRAVAFDHGKCFRMDPLPAKVWSGDAQAVLDWFEDQGTPMPRVPVGAGGLELVGGRYCPLFDLSIVPHLYYTSAERRVSLFVLPRSLRISAQSYTTPVHGSVVRFMKVGGRTVAIVGASREDVEAFRDAFGTSVAVLLDAR